VVRWRVKRGMGKIVMGFRGVRFVELVRRFGGEKIFTKVLPEILKGLISRILNE
jgi:hypothetical protein